MGCITGASGGYILMFGRITLCPPSQISNQKHPKQAPKAAVSARA